MVQCFAPDCNHQSESHTCKLKFFGFPSKEKKNEECRRWIRLLRFVYFFAHKYCNSIKLNSSVCTRKASAKQFTTNRVQVSSMSIGALFWFGNIRGLSLLLHYISLTFPNQTIIKCLQSKKVRKWIIRGLILCDDVVSQYVQSRSERVYSKITWLSLAFQDRIPAYVLPFILTFLIALLKGSREISLSDFLLSYISRKTGRKTEPSQYSRVCSCHFRDGSKSLGPEICGEMKTKFSQLKEDHQRKRRK